jgi:hypothetical protein
LINRLFWIYLVLFISVRSAGAYESDEKMMAALCGTPPIHVGSGAGSDYMLACKGCPSKNHADYDNHMTLWDTIPGSYTSHGHQILAIMTGCGGWEENRLILMTRTSKGWRKEFEIPQTGGDDCLKLTLKGHHDALVCKSVVTKGDVQWKKIELLTFTKDHAERHTLLDGFWTSGSAPRPGDTFLRDPTACSNLLPGDIRGNPDRSDSFHLYIVSKGSPQSEHPCDYDSFSTARFHADLEYKFDGINAVLSTSSATNMAMIQQELRESPADPGEMPVVNPEPLSARDLAAQRLAAAIQAQDGDAPQKDFTAEMRKFLTPAKTAETFRGLTDQFGRLKALDHPRPDPQGQVTYRGRFERGDLDVKIAFDRKDMIAGLWFQPHQPEIPVPDRNSTALSLPFHGRWLVFWGGDTAEINHHHDTPNQRFAFDILGADDGGRTHRGDGAANEDYFCFGREILAPADGEVVQAIEGVDDNRPGSMNPYSALGNSVTIRHSELEYSVIAHLKRGSVRVKAGDKVSRGQVLGLCGNSGNSSEPHLHYHLQNTAVIQDGSGIKVFFGEAKVLVDRKPLPRSDYSPVKGDVLIAE